MDLLEEVCHCAWAQRFKMFKLDPVSFSLSLWLVDPDVELGAPSQPHVCLRSARLSTVLIMD